MIALPRLTSRAADFDLLRSIRFKPLHLDFQDTVVETRLDLVGINPERQLDGAREGAVSTLATLPIAVLLLQWTPGAFEGQHIFLQVERDIVSSYAGQLTGYHDAVAAEPDVDRWEVACSRGVAGEQTVHLA